MPEQDIELAARLIFVAGERNGVAYYRSKATSANVTADDMRKFGLECYRAGMERQREFFREVAELTLRHETLHFGNEDYAVVYPSKLGAALERVDPEWAATAIRKEPT